MLWVSAVQAVTRLSLELREKSTRASEAAARRASRRAAARSSRGNRYEMKVLSDRRQHVGDRTHIVYNSNYIYSD